MSAGVPQQDPPGLTEKGKFYMAKRRRGPKEGPRKENAEDRINYDENHRRIYDYPKCRVCNKEIPWLFRNMGLCDEHKEEKSQ